MEPARRRSSPCAVTRRTSRLGRFVQLLGLALLTLFCAGVVSAEEGARGLSASAATTARGAREARSAGGLVGAPAIDDGHAGSDIELDALEVDVDDDDVGGDRDRLDALATGAGVVQGPRPPPVVLGPPGADDATDPSRIGARGGLARGPPA